MKLGFATTLFLFGNLVWGQSNPWFDYNPLAQVKEFLQLSDSQLQTILTNNEEYNRWSMEKQNRMRQVQSEIADETARAPLDPSALGIRYAEIESICREMKSRATEYRTRNLDVLNAEQKTKMKVLDDAMRLASTITEAQYANLAGEFATAPSGFTSTSRLISGSILGAIIAPVNGCYMPSAVGGIRAGFVANPLSEEAATMPEKSTSIRSIRWFNTMAAQQGQAAEQK